MMENTTTRILTKRQVFSSDAFRRYRDEENRPNHNGSYIKDNSHWLDYGVKLQQTFNLKLSKGIDIISRTEAEYDKDFIYTNLDSLRESNRIFFNEDISF